MADEVTDASNHEQMSLVLRYVHNTTNEVEEAFLDLVTMERVTGAELANAIISRLATWNLPLENCRGQGYDGAANMSAARKGCQARIAELSPLAFYVHCAAHQLNLSIVQACSIPEVRNAHTTIAEIARFLDFRQKDRKCWTEFSRQVIADRRR
jgi:hypothetical protein